MSRELERELRDGELSRYAPTKRRKVQGSEVGPVSLDRSPEVKLTAGRDQDPDPSARRYRLPRSLEPSAVPEPCWSEPRARMGSGMVIRLAGATAVAAVVALLVVGKIPSSWIPAASGKASEHGSAADHAARVTEHVARASSDRPKVVPQLLTGDARPQAQGHPQRLNLSLSAAAPGAMVIIDGLETGSTLSVGRASRTRGWRLMAADLDEAMVQPPPDFSGVMELAVELHLADDTVSDRKLARLAWNAPPPAPKSAPPPQPAPVPSAVLATPTPPALVLRQLDPEEVAGLVRRGEGFIASGDIASARLLLQRAAEAGDVRAALALAGTYDPNVLAKLGVQGAVADVAMARLWYHRAREFGSPEAPGRLEQLAHLGSPR